VNRLILRIVTEVSASSEATENAGVKKQE